MALSNRLVSMFNSAARSQTIPTLGCSARWISSAKLFIGGLSFGTDDMSLREAFGKYGDIVEARVIMDRDTGRSRGFGFVTFSSSEDASSAIQAVDGQVLHGRTVRVNYATDRARGFGGSGGYGSGGGGYGNGGGGYGSGGGGYGGGGGGYGGGGYGGGGYGGGGYGGGGYGGGDYGGGSYGNTGSNMSGGGGGGYDQRNYGGGGGDGRQADIAGDFGRRGGGKSEDALGANGDDMPGVGNEGGDFGTGDEDNYLDDDDEAYNRK